MEQTPRLSDAYEWSTEVFLPSNNSWTTGGNFPRQKLFLITMKIILIMTLQIHLSKLPTSSCLFSMLLIFSGELLILPRRLAGHRAVNLNQQVIVTGGKDNARNYRDEVLLFNEESRTWSGMNATLELGRYKHAVVEVNLAVFCDAIGNHNPSKK